jgi:hypothetical protein
MKQDLQKYLLKLLNAELQKETNRYNNAQRQLNYTAEKLWNRIIQSSGNNIKKIEKHIETLNQIEINH